MGEPFLVFGQPVIGEAEIAEVVDSLRSGWIGSGPKVQRFESMLRAYAGTRECRCVSSCTAALQLALQALGVGRGDEVIVPAMTFVATVNAVVHAGAEPVLVDCEPSTGLIDLDAAEAAIGHRTRAIIPVHMAGRPVDLDRLADLSARHGVHVVEDAAHALGARWRGRPIGAFGNVTAYSFYVTKNITTVEGGAIVTDDRDLAEKVERLALHGLSQGAWQRFSDAGFRHYDAIAPGHKHNMTDIQAALGIHQLPRLEGWIERRAELAQRYDELLADLPLETPAPAPPHVRDAHHLYRVLVAPEAALTRDELLDSLTAQGIGAGVHYRAVHLHPYYRERLGLRDDDLPVATDMSARTLSLPLSPALTEADLTRVARALSAALTPDRTSAGTLGGSAP